ncbi:ABC transporter ATP-binding protein [Methylobacterium nigriterrae]|uniref:ABC transporter ATP-binding protein n=1 Tax=Methylobacterium nigriterrae TaxID=3127512 RepID=UPI00301347A2
MAELPRAGASASGTLLRLAQLTKRFGAHTAVEGVSLDLTAGEFMCLLGPSGCGKSTLLRLVAGFEAPSSGSISLDGRDLAGLPPHRRPVNMMFQSYALFPHMSVAGNVAYGLKGLGLSRSAVGERVGRLLRLVRLDAFAERRPDRLSGGQRQRVALARALAREPRVLLLDEPLGALDRSLREETQGELRALQRRLATTFVVVTHDPAEAMTLADRIGVMDRGRLVQVGPAADLYERPVSRFVAGLLGDVNLIEGRVGPDTGGASRTVETALGPIRALPPSVALSPDAGVVVAIRPERIALAQGPEAGREEELAGTITETTFLGERIRRQVRMRDGSLLRVSTPAGGTSWEAGTPVRLGFPPEAAVILPA